MLKWMLLSRSERLLQLSARLNYTVSNQKEEYISIQRVKRPTAQEVKWSDSQYSSKIIYNSSESSVEYDVSSSFIHV